MKPDIKIGWTVVAFLAALGLAMAISATVKADVPTLEQRIAAVVPSLASKKDEPVDAAELASAIVEVSKGNRQWSALLLTVAASESALAERVRLDQYSPHEGDSYKDADGVIKHRASGLWQVHANAINAPEWGSSDLRAQARMGSRAARGAYYMCKAAGVPFPLGVFRALGHGSCTRPLKGEERRVALFDRLVKRL